ncbi:hypothetical protein K1T71_000046 [Dendrolimus kikuchii]|uniref:Uncharacterized protein n=1 Tax=Dendrolimus kikuchii TaxID=765133 RepID=A0ACC1DI50_9NEOP|nr:hypothetical protein K1T71_000046 [Dendrolimus kikuchii]
MNGSPDRPKRRRQRRSSLPSEFTDISSPISTRDCFKSQRSSTTTNTSDRSIQTDSTIDFDKVSKYYYSNSKNDQSQKDEYVQTSPDHIFLRQSRFLVHAEINQFSSRAERRISSSTDSTSRKSSIISALKTSPLKKDLATSKVISSKSNRSRQIKFIEPEKYRESQIRSPSPPSPAPRDPTLEESRVTFNFKKIIKDKECQSNYNETHPFRADSPSPSNDNISRLHFECETPDITHEFQLPTCEEQQQERAVYEETHHNRYYDSHASMRRMNLIEEHERKLIIEFCHLLEKSKQLFNGLRELPQYGHKQWQTYFGRTFDVYTKLWKFQQQHRAVLDTKYGLKRWQIGEIASKIGQLYYHFYLRTSEMAYLHEAYSFYYAIRGRSYYTQASKEDKCELMVKKLRYYARFIVVCLLLKKLKLVKELIKELDKQITEYGTNYDPDDHIEWTVVVDEVKAFIQAESVVSVIHPDNYPVILSHRLNPLATPPVERSAQMNLSLQEVLIIGSSSQQVKFSELTMDMFRMLQTLEREPSAEIQHTFDDSPSQRFIPTPSAPTKSNAPRRENPHKYLLFKPSPNQILVYLASGCNDLPPNAVLLLYISAEGQMEQPSKNAEDGYDTGGLITTSKSDIYRDCSKEGKSVSYKDSKYKELQCLFPGDLYPFTRRPLFIIIDSDNSYVFQYIPRLFAQPLVILMSPVELPTNYQDRPQQGNLFTLFLHSPLTAFCYCCDIRNLSLSYWERGQTYVEAFLIEASQIFIRSRIDPMYFSFMGDDFLRLLILRFVFCEVMLRVHKGFRSRSQLPRSSPQIPDEILDHSALIHIVMDLASYLQVRNHFIEPSGSCPQTSKD